MALPLIISEEKDFNALDAKCQEHYTKTGDKWVLDCPGAVPKKQLDEFRDSNVALKKELEVYGKEGERLTPEQLKEIKKKAEEHDAGTSKEKIDKLVETRVTEMKTKFESDLEAEKGKVTKLTGDLESLVIDKALIEAGGELGLRTTAHEDLTFRGRAQFKLDEHGKPVAKDKDGNTLYNAAGDPLSPKDFVTKLTKDAPHLFDTSTGSGAGGSGNKGGQGGGNTNPWKKESFSLTEQSRIYKENPEQAKQLAAAAGVTL